MGHKFDSMIAKFVKAPVLKVWTPSKWDILYYGRTPKRLVKETEKRAAQNKSEYERNMMVFNCLTSEIAEIKNAPKELSDFFISTIISAVEYARNSRAQLILRGRQLKEKYAGKHVELPAHGGGTFKLNISSHAHEFADAWNNVKKAGGEANVKNGGYRFEEYLHLADTEAERYAIGAELAELASNYTDIHSIPTAYNVISQYATSMHNMLQQMEKVLGGKPEGVEPGQEWGINGHYNGIVFGNGNRASFKSFLAGGWNIQRLHVRCRVTLLKEGMKAVA